MTLEEFTDVTDFPLTPEIRQLGFSRVYTCFNSNREQLLLVERTGIESNPLQCKYDKSNFKNTAKELESVLTISGVDHKTAKKFIALLAKLCIETELQHNCIISLQRGHSISISSSDNTRSSFCSGMLDSSAILRD